MLLQYAQMKCPGQVTVSGGRGRGRKMCKHTVQHDSPMKTHSVLNSSRSNTKAREGGVSPQRGRWHCCTCEKIPGSNRGERSPQPDGVVQL